MPPIPQRVWSRLDEGARCLPEACAGVSEQFYVNQLVLAANLLIDSINAARDNVNAHMVTELEFSFNDLRQLTRELMPAEQRSFDGCFEILEAAIGELRDFVPFPDVEDRLVALRGKVRERIEANDRSKFAPPEAVREPLPHPPETLQDDAREIRGELHAAGFTTPVLDTLAERPEAFEIRDCEALIEEIDTIVQ